MSEQKFNRMEAIRFGWSTALKNLWFFVGILIILWVISAAFQFIGNRVANNIPLAITTGIVSAVINAVITMGMIKITLKFVDGQKGEFGDLLACWPLTLKYLASMIIYGLMVMGGFILLIIPGIILALRGQFFGYYIVDKNQGPLQAIKSSVNATRGSALNLFVLWILFIGIAILGVLALIVGLFVALPTIMVAAAFVFRKLTA